MVDQLESMEVGLGRPWELPGSDGEGVSVAMFQASDIVGVEISTDEPAAAASRPRSNASASEKTALAVAATAAVELTNLFFLLRGGDADPRCRRRRRTIERLAVLFAFAAFLSAAGFVLVRRGTGQRTAISDARRRVLLVASAAALSVASAGTVLSLLSAAQGWRGAV